MEVTERLINSNDWITIILMIVVALFVFNKLNNNERFNKIQSILFNNTYINDYSKSTPLLLNNFHIVFFIISGTIISLIAFSFLEMKHIIADSDGIMYFLKIFVFVMIFMVLRAIIGYWIGVLFEKEQEQLYITFIKMSYLVNFCFAVFPFLVISFYVDSQLYKSLFFIGSILLLLFYYFLILKENQKLIFSNIFYFILYLCALEISPLVIIYKTIIA